MRFLPSHTLEPQLVLKLEQAWQKISVMEISLQDLLAKQKLDEQQYQERSKALQIQRDHIRSIMEQLVQEKKLSSKTRSFDLPKLNKLSPLESQAVESYFNDSYLTSRDSYRSLIKLAPWVEAAATGKAALISIFRLAKIRRYLNKMKEENQKTLLDIEQQERLLRKMSSATLGRSYDKQRSLMETVQLAFASVDNIKKNILDLEEKVVQKKKDIQFSKNALGEIRLTIRKKLPDMSPELGSIQAITKNLNTFGMDKIQGSRDRLTLAKTYVDSYIHKYSSWDEAKQFEDKHDGAY